MLYIMTVSKFQLLESNTKYIFEDKYASYLWNPPLDLAVWGHRASTASSHADAPANRHRPVKVRSGGAAARDVV